jgi:NAD(P)-dependent dehydrogenase (short-subunit alcohol dehydrogenase family)
VRLGLSARQAGDHHRILVISVAASSWSSTPEDLRLMIDVNVGAALWLTQAVVPYLRDRGSGSIVHVTARPGLEPAAGMATSAVSKAALVHLTRVLDLELRPLGRRLGRGYALRAPRPARKGHA